MHRIVTLWLAALGAACGTQIFVEDRGKSADGNTTSASSTGSATQGVGGSTSTATGGASSNCFEDPSFGQPCATGQAGICEEGTFYCADNALTCVPDEMPQSEECDGIDNDCDGTIDDGACSKIVFATSQLFQGNLGGLVGADAICQSLADNANLPGVFKAWLSDMSTSASQRLNHHDGPYVLVDQTIVALDWNDLTAGFVIHSIDLTEWGLPPPVGTGCPGGFPLGGPAWSNTKWAGELYSPDYCCYNWTSNTYFQAHFGDFGSEMHWTMWCSGGTSTVPECSFTAVLYCFEQ